MSRLGESCNCRAIAGWGVAIVVCLVLLAGLAQAQPAGRPWRETIQLDVPLLAAKRFENAKGLIEQQEWDAALTALADLEKEFPSALLSLEPGRYVSVPLASRLLRLHLPEAGREVYRQQIDGWAEQQLTSALARNDEGALRQVVENGLASGSGATALDRLAELAWERGDIADARRLWTKMIPVAPEADAMQLLRSPHRDIDLAAVHARLVLCSLAEGDFVRAADEAAMFADLFPEVEGHLAGRDGVLIEILDSLIEHPTQWNLPANEPSWPTFAGAATRNAKRQSRRTIGRPLWTLPLKPIYVPRWERPRAGLPEYGVLSRHAVTWGDGLFLHDGTTIFGLRQSDGKPLWPLDGGNTTDETPGKVYPPFPAIPHSLPWTPVVGVPRYTSSVDADRLYALMGPSVLTFPEGAGQGSPTRLVCIDLAQEGLLEWFHIPEDLFDAGWLPTGTPVADAQRLYVPLVRSHPQIELAVACLNAKDGSVVWQQTVGQALREALGGRVELGHQLLTLAEGRVYFATDFGGIAALEAATGRPAWVVTYPSISREAIDRSDEGAMGLLPPLYAEGTLFVKPNDSDLLLAIDAASGAVHWRRRPPGSIVHLLGARGDLLFVSGEQLWGMDIDTGRPRWRFGYDDAAGYGYGRGVLAGDHVIWPTREDLYVVDRQTGQPVQRKRLYESLGLSGGNLIAAGPHLFITGTDHVTAFELSE